MLQVYHVDDDKTVTPVGEETPSSGAGAEVTVDAESFSVYAVTVVREPVEVQGEYYLYAGQSIVVREVNLDRATTRNVTASSDSRAVSVLDVTPHDGGLIYNDYADVEVRGRAVGNAVVTLTFEYKNVLGNWKHDSVSFKVHVLEPREIVLGEDLNETTAEVLLGGFTVDEKNVENWFRSLFGKDPKNAFQISYEKGGIVTAEVTGVKNGYSILDMDWAEKAAVAQVRLTPAADAAGKSETVTLAFDVVGGERQTVSFTVTFGAKHTVTFLDGETVLDTQEVDHGASAAAPAAPEKAGYTFERWDAEFSNVTADLTVNAVYQVCEHKVMFVSGTETYKEVTVQHGGSVKEPAAPSKVGYAFGGWYLNGQPYNFTASVTDDITLTAQWNAAKGNVQYFVSWQNWDTEGGVKVQSPANFTETGASARRKP